ncbi:hypothetical protein [Mycobacterium szulgai]|uniref:DUF3592 domain-containing protein n=1 Tax=Mycobacterium szulgai TaxID=1787 RepID=A0A1X2EDT8_MYCSZ|nr:hypothetical protein [Mycobacterium szulgai]MCV7075141.1 hypothetical protein [Mycobacterium szulgai]ORW98517.1 hypothetical protein AWC27_03820 [Mycobacterium szulgai]
MDAAHALGILHDLAAIPLRERIGYLIGIAVMIGAAVGAIRRWMQRNPTIRGDALTGTAQVLSMKRAGWLDNDHRPYLRLKLGVQVPGQEPYEVTVQRSVDSVYLSRVQPGATLPVQVDPVNPQIVRLIFDQSIA